LTIKSNCDRLTRNLNRKTFRLETWSNLFVVI